MISIEQLKELSLSDQREVRNFQRFLKLKPRYYQEMLKRPIWRKYLGINSDEALIVAQNDWDKKKSKLKFWHCTKCSIEVPKDERCKVCGKTKREKA